jgi:copper chaperone NosL
MIISEARFAAAYYTDSGDVRRFDDIGDMCKYHVQNQEDVAHFWVHDYDTEAWLIADEAIFVMSNDLYTPMASGVVAFSDMERGGSFANESKGVLMTFEELMAVYSRAEAGGTHNQMNN